jgi:hypothetical protein
MGEGKRVALMNTSITLGLLILLVAILVLRRVRRAGPQIAAFRSKDVPLLWADHIQFHHTLLGVRQIHPRDDVHNFKEMNPCSVSQSIRSYK